MKSIGILLGTHSQLAHCDIGLPYITDARLWAVGFEPELADTFCMRVYIFNRDCAGYNWLAADLDFWISIFPADFDLIRTGGWPALGVPRSHQGRILSQSFIPCNPSKVIEAIRSDPLSAAFFLEVLGGKQVEHTFPIYSQYFDSSILEMSYHPLFIGSSAWVTETCEAIVEYYKSSAHIEFLNIKDFDGPNYEIDKCR